MLKRIINLSMAMLALLFFAVPANAQTPMPLNPKIKHGTLENGLNYYILHNEEPKGKANFYIAQKVGSTLENQDQLGLAHFLEHMAFNGTKNYPGKNMLNYLQAKGIRFGADINAYTGFDETVYNINNIPTSDQALMDSVLLVLRDWSCDILLEDAEIDAERGVIREEWRSRENAFMRYYGVLLPQIYQEYQYQQLPIGKMEVVMNFPYQALKDYYHKWYRPDQQGIIIVGDFDADAMEKKVKEMFSTIKMPENAAPRVYPSVSDNTEPIYVSFQDKEAPTSMVAISFKSDKLPFEQRNTAENYMQTVVQRLISVMVNNRLNEFAKKAECNYVDASVSFGNYYVSKTKDAFDINITPKEGKTLEATRDAMEIVARAFKTGFTDSEYTRAKDEMLAAYEKAYNERDKTNSNSLAREIINHFTDNEPNPGIETEYQIINMAMTSIPVSALNPMLKEIMTPDNQVITVFQPEKEGLKLPTREEMLNVVEGSLGKEYEAYEDVKLTEPFLKNLGAEGKVVSTKEDATLGTTTYELSNGVKVVIKPTDFAADEILMTGFWNGGMETIDPANPINRNVISAAVETCKFGNYNADQVERYLAGKNISIDFDARVSKFSLNGRSTVKDLQTLLEFVYAYCTEVTPDPEYAATVLDQIRTQLKAAENNPQFIFSQAFNNTLYNNDPRMISLSLKNIENIDYNRVIDFVKNATSNARDFTFIFTGNINPETFVPLITKYLGALPSKAKATPAGKTYPVKLASGEVMNAFTKEMATPSTMYYSLAGNKVKNYTVKEDLMVDLAGEILGNVYTRTIREEEGGAYSPGAQGISFEQFGEYFILSAIQTNAEQQKRVIEISKEQLHKLFSEGASEEDFNKVKNAALNQLENKLRNNNFWQSNLYLYLTGYDMLTTRKATLENLTLKDFNDWMKTQANFQSNITVMMEGVAPVAK